MTKEKTEREKEVEKDLTYLRMKYGDEYDVHITKKKKKEKIYSDSDVLDKFRNEILYRNEE